jgi:lauroyl/myristoyl acyltransferase
MFFAMALFLLLSTLGWKKQIFKTNTQITGRTYTLRFYYQCLWNMCADASTFLFTAKYFFHPEPKDFIPSKPFFLASMHYSQFELLASLLQSWKFDFKVFHTPLKQPFWNQLLQKLRNQQGGYTVDQSNLQLYKHSLTQKNSIGFLVDQAPRTPTYPHPFLGYSCYHSSIITHSLKNYPHHLFAYIQRKSFLRYSIHIQSGNFTFSQLIELCEQTIHLAPTQWYGWFHKRFKHTNIHYK